MDTATLATLRADVRATRRSPTSLEQVVQLISAEFCASLSQAVLVRQGAPAAESVTTLAAEQLLSPVRLDLSAHYGSMAVRRGRGRRLGPCNRRGTSVTRGSAMHLWQCRKLARLWCPRCGVRLLPSISICRVPESVVARSGSQALPRRVCARCMHASAQKLVRIKKIMSTAPTSAGAGQETIVNALQQSALKQRRRKRRRAGGDGVKNTARQPHPTNVTNARPVSAVAAPRRKPHPGREPPTTASVGGRTSRQAVQLAVSPACIPTRTGRNRQQRSDKKCPAVTAKQGRNKAVVAPIPDRPAQVLNVMHKLDILFCFGEVVKVRVIPPKIRSVQHFAECLALRSSKVIRNGVLACYWAVALTAMSCSPGMHACWVCPTYVDFTVFRCYLADYEIEETVGEIVRQITHDHESAGSITSTHTGHHRRDPTHRTWRASYPEEVIAVDCTAVGLEEGHQFGKASLSLDAHSSRRSSARGVASGSPPHSTPAGTSGAVTATTPAAAATPASDGNVTAPPEGLNHRGHHTRHRHRHGGDGKLGSAHRKHASTHGSVALTAVTTTETGTMSPTAVSDAPCVAGLPDTHSRRTSGHNDRGSQSFRLGTALVAYEWPWCRSGQTHNTGATVTMTGQEGGLNGVAGEALTLAQHQQRLLLTEEVTEQYHLFRFLAGEYLLATPYAFLASHALPVDVNDRRRMVEMYYASEPVVFRRYFGQRLLSYKRGDEAKSSWRINLACWLPWRWRGRGSAPATAVVAARKVGDEGTDDGLREGARRRRWVNLHHVCTTIAAMYRGEGGVYVAADVPVLTAVQQCFALRGTLARYYATSVFGFEHGLAGRLFDHLRSYDDYVAVCDLLGELWCDESHLLLRESFVDGCRRLSRLLEDSRVLAEVHQALFDESMRPRWQMQLDEVQRVIIPTTNTAEKTHAAPNSTLHLSTSLPCLTTKSSPSGAVSTGMGATASVGVSVQERHDARPSPAVSSRPPLAGTVATAAPPMTRGVGNSALGMTTLGAAAASVNVCSTTQAASGAIVQQRSANQLFTRRFLLLFGSLMKQLARVAAYLGLNESINDALEVYCNRVFSVLGTMGTRPQTTPAASQPSRPPICTTSTPVPATLTHTAVSVGCAPTATTCTPTAMTLERTTDVRQAALSPTLAAVDAIHTTTPSQSHYPGNTLGDKKDHANACVIYPPTTTTPHSVADSTMADSHVRRSLSAPQLPAQTAHARTEHAMVTPNQKQAVATSKSLGSGRDSSPLAAHSSIQSEPLVLDCTGHHELRELCQMLSMLPGVWCHLTSITADEHEELDTVVANLMDALRSITQLLLASEDVSHR